LLDGRHAFAEPRLVDFADRRRLHIGLGKEVEQMSFADQSYANESDANAFVRSENILVSRRAENPRASGLQKAAPVFHIVFLLKALKPLIITDIAKLRGL